MSAVAQNCGTPPPSDTQFSSNFQKAVLKILDESSHQSHSTNLTAITEAAFLDFGFNSDQQTVVSARNQLNVQQAAQFIQQEYKDKSAQIIAECGYRMCNLAAQHGQVLATAGLANVCSIAVDHGEMGDYSHDTLQPLPGAIPYIFTSGQKSAFYAATLAYNGPGEVLVDLPAATDNIRVASPRGHRIRLEHSRYAQIRFHLTRPSEPVTEEMVFRDNKDVQTSATFAFTLVPDESDLYPPASIPCGTINPNLASTAYSDIAPGQGFDPKTFTDNGWRPVPDGETSRLASTFSEYHNDGGGQASATLETSCSQVNASQTQVLTIIKIRPHLWALSGHCCSGFGPGGMNAANPEWTATISLPGNPQRYHWHLHVQANVTPFMPSRKCTFSVDGQRATVPVDSPFTSLFELSPGNHQLDEQCSSAEWGARPGQWNSSATAEEDATLTLLANRETLPAVGLAAKRR